MNFINYKDGIMILQGEWTKHNANIILNEMQQLPKLYKETNAEAISNMDTIGAMLLADFSLITQKTIENKVWYPLFAHIKKIKDELVDVDKEKDPFNFIEYIYRQTYDFIKNLLLFINFVGELFYNIFFIKSNKQRSLREKITPYVANLNNLGTNSLPIILLLSFIVGGIIYQQGAFQLRSFAVELYSINLSTILIYREIGILITSIIIAGRCGSAITAELGVMKMRNEIDALEVMGINVFATLYMPRTIAIIISMPLLTVCANLSATMGAALMAYFYSNLSFQLFFLHLKENLCLSTFCIGIIKSPILAFAIVNTAIIESKKVSGSSRSLGKRIISCVVKSIFFVITIDGVMSIIFTGLNI